MKNKILCTTRNIIPYVKELRQLPLVRSVASAILMQQLDYWFDKYPDGFYKFMQPCPSHQAYKHGDSWAEELAFSSDEFRSAFDAIGKRYTSKSAWKQAADPFEDLYYCSYQDKKEGITWYFRNHALVDSALEILHYRSENPDDPQNPQSKPFPVDGQRQSTVDGQRQSTVDGQRQSTVDGQRQSLEMGNANLRRWATPISRDGQCQSTYLYTEITPEITSEISSPLTPQSESGEEKYVLQKSVHQTLSPSPAQPPKLETQLQLLNSRANPNQDQAPLSSLGDDKTLKVTDLSQTPKAARRKTEKNAEAETCQQDTQRSPKYAGASSSASTDLNRQRKLPLPPWRNSVLANDYYEEFVDYLATQHLPHCSVYRQSGKQPTKGDAKNWILTREAKGEEAQIQNKWEDYQALKTKPDTSKPEKQRELTVWEKQMRSQYEEERSRSTHPEEKALTKQELIAQIEAGTTRRKRVWPKHQNRAM